METKTFHAKKVLVALFTMLISLLANAYDFEKDGFYYGIISLKDSTVELTFGENKYVGDIVVPDKVEYADRIFKVSRLGDNCFSSCGSVLSIKLPSSIKTIGSYAFSGCYNLISLTIPSFIEEIGLGESSTNGKYCFSGCRSLEHIIFEDSEESLLLHPNTWIDGSISTFTVCPIKSLYIGRDVWCYPVYSYTDNPFYRKNRLTNIVFGELVTRIDSHMFENCVGLERIDIPSNITYIGNSAFKGCTKLKDIHLAEGVRSIQSNAFEDCESIQELILPASIINISEKAFYNCKDIQNVKVLAVTPSEIHDNAFSLSVYMNSILVVPNGCKTLYENTEGWKNFTNIIESTENEDFNPFKRLCVNSGTGGRLMVGDNIVYNTSCEFTVKESDSLIINIVPSKGFYLQSFEINNENSIADVCNKTIELNPIGDVHNIEAVFCKSPIYQINYVVDGDTIKTDSVAYGEVITIPNEPTKTGHTFSGWGGVPEIMPANDITISGTFTINKYIVTFKIGNETIASDTLEYGAKIILPEAPEKEGCTFDGWKNVAETVPARNLTYRGYYSINSYMLAYVLDGDTIQKSSITYGKAITVIDAPEKEGYTFSGWGKVPETMPAEDVIVSGTFMSNKYLVTFKIGGEVVVADSLEYKSAIVAPEAPEKEGYTFSGWGVVADSVPAHDLTYEGSYSINSYTLTYLVDGEVVLTLPVVYGAIIPSLKAPEKEGYVFSGWSEAPATMPAKDVTIEGTFTQLHPNCITVNQYGSGTYCSPYALDFSNVEKLKAYAATGYNELTGVVTLTRVMTAKDGVGLFIKGEPGEYMVPIMENSVDNTLNMLVGTLAKTSVNATSDDGLYANYKYTIKAGEAEPKFYQFTDGSTLGAGKAYLQIPVAWLPQTSETKSISLRFEEGEGTTDIENSQFTIDNSQLTYDLYGRRVDNPVKGGIYIVGGRKVVL